MRPSLYALRGPLGAIFACLLTCLLACLLACLLQQAIHFSSANTMNQKSNVTKCAVKPTCTIIFMTSIYTNCKWAIVHARQLAQTILLDSIDMHLQFLYIQLHVLSTSHSSTSTSNALTHARLQDGSGKSVHFCLRIQSADLCGLHTAAD